MQIEKILNEYDSMFGRCSLDEIEQFLVDNINNTDDSSILFTLLNEIIGFCRDTTQKEKALKYCEDLKRLMNAMGIEGSAEYATAMLNIANAYRAFDMADQAVEIFERVLLVYNEKLQPFDFNYASLYNNWSLAYQELGEFEKAKEKLLQAMEIVDTYEEAIIPQATTRTNLAASLIQMGTDEAYDEAMIYLQEALNIFEKDGGRDFHYRAALVTMGDACSYKEQYEKAANYYLRGLKETQKHVGKTEDYMRILEKYEYAKEQAGEEVWISNLDRSKKFYEEFGRPMIHSKFPEYEERIAVGLVGEGSDCFGFDDKISTDHDYDLGFCMWLTKEDFENIGKELQNEYEKLISSDSRLSFRRGVFEIEEFYDSILEEEPKEYQLATATNGEVFKDDLGVFTSIREDLLEYYPDLIWRRKIAQCMHDFAQYAQSNYARMMARKDVITANLCIAKAVESTMDLMYLMNRKYAPYYKWKRKGLECISGTAEVLGLLDKLVKMPVQTEAWDDTIYDAKTINTKDECVMLFEKIAELILKKLDEIGLVNVTDTFLENYMKQILEGKNMDIIEKIVDLEWKQFDKVENRGGRADCQDNFETFSIMRKSQYLTWTEEMLVSYCNDLIAADNKGWNLIMEKYARMMKSTNPEEYAQLEENLPVLSEDRIRIQEEVIKIQVAWMEEAVEKYPRMTSNMRSVRTSTDNAFNTSYETYLRGELGTYSENTFILYTGFVISLLKAGRNLALETIENTAKLYGYVSTEEAEEKMENVCVLKL